MKPLQDLNPDDFAHCYGCGRLNADGLHVKSEWRDGEAVARFHPAPQHIALPGFVYGGLIASLIDRHAMATAAAASMEKAGVTPGVDPVTRRRALANGIPLQATVAEPHPRYRCGIPPLAGYR